MAKYPKYDCVQALHEAGLKYGDAQELRRIAMTLHRWSELECGADDGGIDRDETTGKVWWYNANLGKRTHVVADREKGALKRLETLMSRYPHLSYYVQGDPRGAPLCVIRPGDIPAGSTVDSSYNRGIAVCK